MSRSPMSIETEGSPSAVQAHDLRGLDSLGTVPAAPALISAFVGLDSVVLDPEVHAPPYTLRSNRMDVSLLSTKSLLWHLPLLIC